MLKKKCAQILLRELWKEIKENICEDSAFVYVKISWLKDLNDTFLAASLLKNTGLVVANDAKKERTKALVANIHRLGEFCVSVLPILPASLVWPWRRREWKFGEVFIHWLIMLWGVDLIPYAGWDFITQKAVRTHNMSGVSVNHGCHYPSFFTIFCSTKYNISYHFFLSAGISNTLVCNYDGRAFPRVKYLTANL